jgi:hypothetical protein
MSRPDFVSEEDILRWSSNIDNDPSFPKSLAASQTIREVCYAGLWLAEQLDQLACPDFVIVRIQDAAGRLSFGRNPWEVSQELLEKYENNQLVFEEDPDAVQN